MDHIRPRLYCVYRNEYIPQSWNRTHSWVVVVVLVDSVFLNRQRSLFKECIHTQYVVLINSVLCCRFPGAKVDACIVLL